MHLQPQTMLNTWRLENCQQLMRLTLQLQNMQPSDHFILCTEPEKRGRGEVPTSCKMALGLGLREMSAMQWEVYTGKPSGPRLYPA